MKNAIAVARYFAAHALIFFDQIGEREDLDAARQVLKALEDLAPAFGENQGGPYQVAKQALYQRLRKQRRFAKAEALVAPLRTLEDHGYCRVVKERTPGRPAEHVEVNPNHLKGLQGLKAARDDGYPPPSRPNRPFREGDMERDEDIVGWVA